MFPDSKALSQDIPTVVGTGVSDTYDRRGDDVSSSEFGVSSAPLATPKVLTFSHQTTKDGTKRHLVRLDWTFTNSTTGMPQVASFYTVIVVPSGISAVVADYKKMANEMGNLFAQTTFDTVTKLLNSEI
jgi:hypothetical protein